MKFLIWFLCFFTTAIIQTIFAARGVFLGGLPTAAFCGGSIWLARSLCRKWDEHKNTKGQENRDASATQQPIKKAVPQILFCRKCGERLIANGRFCNKCGTEICVVQHDSTPLERTGTKNDVAINKDNPPVSAQIKNGEKICPKCALAQKATRRVCWSCGQPFDN